MQQPETTYEEYLLRSNGSTHRTWRLWRQHERQLRQRLAQTALKPPDRLHREGSALGVGISNR